MDANTLEEYFVEFGQEPTGSWSDWYCEEIDEKSQTFTLVVVRDDFEVKRMAYHLDLLGYVSELYDV